MVKTQNEQTKQIVAQVMNGINNALGLQARQCKVVGLNGIGAKYRAGRIIELHLPTMSIRMPGDFRSALYVTHVMSTKYKYLTCLAHLQELTKLARQQQRIVPKLPFLFAFGVAFLRF